MSLYLSSEMISYDMDSNRNEGEESKIQAKFIHGSNFTMAFGHLKLMPLFLNINMNMKLPHPY